MKKRSLLDVLLEIRKQSPDAHLYGRSKDTIDSVIESLRWDLEESPVTTKALRGPYYFLKDDHDYMNPMVGVWYDGRGEPMLMFQRESMSRLSGLRNRGR